MYHTWTGFGTSLDSFTRPVPVVLVVRLNSLSGVYLQCTGYARSYIIMPFMGLRPAYLFVLEIHLNDVSSGTYSIIKTQVVN